MITGQNTRKVAFVTGGGSGIGKAAAEEFVRRGYSTVVAEVNGEAGAATEMELRKLGECTYVSCDVSDDEAVREAVGETIRLYGQLDAAFNAAGTEGEQGKRTAECTLENWDRVLAVNLTGVWSSMRHEIPELLKRPKSSIVNCSSTAGIRGSVNFAAYISSKHGVVGLTRAAALEYGREGLRVNAVCPAGIDTPQFQRLPPERREQLTEVSPVGRVGAPSEIADVVVWLCDEAPGYLTGQIIAIDGAMTAR